MVISYGIYGSFIADLWCEFGWTTTCFMWWNQPGYREGHILEGFFQHQLRRGEVVKMCLHLQPRGMKIPRHHGMCFVVVFPRCSMVLEYLYLQNWPYFGGFYVGKYSSTMVRIWVWGHQKITPFFWDPAVASSCHGVTVSPLIRRSRIPDGHVLYGKSSRCWTPYHHCDRWYIYIYIIYIYIHNI